MNEKQKNEINRLWDCLDDFECPACGGDMNPLMDREDTCKCEDCDEVLNERMIKAKQMMFALHPKKEGE